MIKVTIRMSSRAPSDDELVNLLNNVLTETPTVGVDGSRGGRNREVGQIGDNVGRHVQVNRLTFAEEVTQSAQGKQSEMVAGTSNRDIDSLYIDLTSSGMESSDGGFQMLSARSSGSSTIDSTGVDHTPLVYDIYRFPLTEQEMVGMCNQRQSGGITACIRANCKLNHRGPKLAFQPGSIMVARSGASVFLEPVTSHRNVSEGLLTELKKTPRVLDEWNELFRILNNQEPSQVFTPSLLEDFRVYDKFAKDWKSSSPTKSDTVDSSPLRLVKSSVFVQIVGEETTVLKELFRQEVLMLANEEARDPAPILKTGEWSYDEAFKKLESDVGINTSVINKVTIKLDEVADKVNEEFKVLFTRIESVECTIGPKVIPRNPTLDAPTVWSSIALVASAIDDIQSEILSVKAKNIEYITALELRLTKVLEEQLQEFVDSTVMAITDQEAEGKIRSDRVLKMIDGTKESILMLARGASKLKEEMDELRTAFHMIPVPEAGGTAATEDSSVLSDISSIKVMIRSLGQRIDTVVDGRETKAIKFFGTTFRGHSEAELWVLEHLDNDSFGLIVDVHLVFEHIYQQAFNDEGALKELNGLYKIKIDNLTQGLAMTSFDHPMPKFFSVAVNAVNKKPKVKKPDSSHFDNIDSFEDWDLPIMGFRAVGGISRHTYAYDW